MTRHPLRWDSLIFGLFFLFVVSHWAVRKHDLLTTRELNLTASGVLILLGVVGVTATIWHARPGRTPARPIPTHPTHEGTDDEAADPYP